MLFHKGTEGIAIATNAEKGKSKAPNQHVGRKTKQLEEISDDENCSPNTHQGKSKRDSTKTKSKLVEKAGPPARNLKQRNLAVRKGRMSSDESNDSLDDIDLLLSGSETDGDVDGYNPPNFGRQKVSAKPKKSTKQQIVHFDELDDLLCD